jgi:hypothetical protein
MADRTLHLPTLQELKSNLGRGSKFLRWMEQGTIDYVKWEDDFLGDTIAGDATAPGLYEVVTGSDGAAAILADQTNGVCAIEASAGVGADGEYCGFALPELAYQAQLNCVMGARVTLGAAITTCKVEVGFTDVTTDAGAVNSLAGNTGTATNAAVWVYDTSDNAYWQGFATKAGTPITKLEPAFSPVAGTWEWLIVALEGTNVKFLRLNENGKKTYESPWVADAITATTKLSPWLFVQLRGALDTFLYVDKIFAYQRRTTS